MHPSIVSAAVQEAPSRLSDVSVVLTDNNRQQDEEGTDEEQTAEWQFQLDETASEEDDSDGQVSPRSAASDAARRPAAFAVSAVDRLSDLSEKWMWRPGNYQQLQQHRARRGLRRPSKEMHQQHLTENDDAEQSASGARPLETRRVVSSDQVVNTAQQHLGSFVVEIESEAAEIRTLIARTAQLWSAVDEAERSEDLPLAHYPPQAHLSGCFPTTTARDTPCALLPVVFPPMGDEDGESSTLSSDDRDYEGGDEDEDDTEMESIETDALQHSTQNGGYSIVDELFLASLRQVGGSNITSSSIMPEQGGLGEDDDGSDDDSGESECLDGEEVDSESIDEYDTEDIQPGQGEVMDASNRAINASKARAIKNAMLGNLVLLGFRDGLTRAALEAGVLEIDHYDSDCELAYVDIFMSLVKMVCDAHIDVMYESGGPAENWASQDDGARSHLGNSDMDVSRRVTQGSFLPFKWPIFDMAQFEFGNARPGTCFNSVCVLTNLPKVSMDRTEELMEVLSCNLFCMVGDPIQVVIPSVSSTGRTKGHAFLEFDDPEMAKRCASAVDGLTWGRDPFGRIRGSLFRQYQVKSPAEEHQLARTVGNDGASFPRPYASIQLDQSYGYQADTFDLRESERAERLRADVENHHIQQRSLLRDSDEDDSSGEDEEWAVNRPLHFAQLASSRLLDLSSGSVDITDQHELNHQPGVGVRLASEEEIFDGSYGMRFSSEREEDDEIDGSFGSNSVLEMQVPNEEKQLSQALVDELLQERGLHSPTSHMLSNSPTLISLASSDMQTEPSVAAAAPTAAREITADYMLSEQPRSADADENISAEKPWRKYCEDLIGRNREMQEQAAFARRRIVQLSHNNQKLHLLLDRVERDRDGLLFENDLLQTQLHGYEDHEQHHDALMKELVMLRKRLKRKERKIDLRRVDPAHIQTTYTSLGPLNHASDCFDDIRLDLDHQLSSTALTNYKIDDLKEWEQLLESALGRVRSVKEEKALEMQKKLDRRVEEQNELKLCVICLSNEKSILCLPCRHLCLCETCSGRQEVVKCPICRLEIEEMLAVYA